MRVNQQNNQAIIQNKSPSSERVQKNKEEDRSLVSELKGDGGTLNSSEASISSRAHEMVEAKKIASDASDIREQKIAELKRRIANKEYNVKPSDIADRMVDEHLQTSKGF